MASSRDAEKRQAWEAKFARYRASGLSVSRFCEQEGVSTNTFYYWAKRRRTAAGRQSDGAATASRPSVSTTDRSARGAIVCFRGSAGGEVLVPAECLDVIRCLVECLASAGGPHAATFQEVVVKA
jgi:hypothetical protein